MARRRQHRAALHHMLPDPARRTQLRLILTAHSGRAQTTPKKTSARLLAALGRLPRTRFDPVTLPLKGVGRQGHPMQLPPTPVTAPVHRRAAHKLPGPPPRSARNSLPRSLPSTHLTAIYTRYAIAPQPLPKLPRRRRLALRHYRQTLAKHCPAYRRRVADIAPSRLAPGFAW